jgi:hypothetical protein
MHLKVFLKRKKPKNSRFWANRQIPMMTDKKDRHQQRQDTDEMKKTKGGGGKIKKPSHQCCGYMKFWGGSGSADASANGSGSGFRSRSWIRILLFSSLTFKMPAKK